MLDSLLLLIDREALLASVSALSTALATLMWQRFSERRVKLVRFVTHASTVVVPMAAPQQAVNISSHAMVVVNYGGMSATNVRLGHHPAPNGATGPPNFSIWPNFAHTVQGLEILIPVLAPGEHFTITYIYSGAWANALNTYEKCDQCVAERVNVQPSRPTPPVARWIYRVLLFIGVSTVFYFGFKALWWFLTR